MLIPVGSTHRAAGIVDRLRKVLEERPVVMFVSDVHVSRPEYFA